MLGSKRTENKNWNPDCEEHGLESEWYNNPIQIQQREESKNRSIQLQRLARQRREDTITKEEALRQLDEIYTRSKLE